MDPLGAARTTAPKVSASIASEGKRTIGGVYAGGAHGTWAKDARREKPSAASFAQVRRVAHAYTARMVGPPSEAERSAIGGDTVGVALFRSAGWRPRWVIAALTFALAATPARGAGADAAVPQPSPPVPSPPEMPPPLAPAPDGPAAPTLPPHPVAASRKASPKRALPDYDGRGRAPSTVGQDLLVIPRVIVSPFYITTEYVIRRPLGAAVSAAERSNLPRELYDFFLFGPDHKAGVVPTLFFDFGFSPSVGLYGFWNDAGFKGNDLNAHFSIWTSDWIAGSIGDRIRFGKKSYFSTKLAALRRPDRTFFGLGPSSLQDNLSRYGETRLEASGLFDVPLWRASQFAGGVGFRSVELYDGDYAGEPTVTDQLARGAFPAPPGFGQTYPDEFNHALVALDTRKTGSGTGVRLEAQAEEGNDVRQSSPSAWIRYQGTAGVFVDLNGRGRVLSLSGTALFADPLERGGTIPFTEQVALGGNIPVLSALATGAGLMPGLYAGRLVDRSAAVATLQYRWPIWAWLDGTLQFATGNVFGVHLDELKPGLLRFSGALGIESTGVSENEIHLLIGLGSETFDHGGEIDSVRLAVGTSRF
jgi:hypothetical protein